MRENGKTERMIQRFGNQDILDRLDALELLVQENHQKALDHAENLFALMIKITDFNHGETLEGVNFSPPECLCLHRLGFDRVDFHRVILNRPEGGVTVTRGHDDYILTVYCPKDNDPYDHDDMKYLTFTDLLLDLAAILDLAG